MLVLKALTRGAMHGYAIVEFIQQSSDDILRVEEGALYPALHRLELRGLLSAEWGVSEKQPPRQVLRAHRRGTEIPGGRVLELDAPLGRRLARDANGLRHS